MCPNSSTSTMNGPIKFYSNRPVKHAYNVIVSQTIPILYLSNDVIMAKQELCKLISTLASNGFRKQKLLQMVISTISKTNTPPIKFEVNDLVATLQGKSANNHIIVFH